MSTVNSNTKGSKMQGQFSSPLLLGERIVAFYPSLANALNGDVIAALVLQQIHYWISNPHIGKIHEGRRWVRNSYESWVEDNFSFLSNRTIRRAIDQLCQRGLVDSANLNDKAFDHTKWYSVNYVNLQALYDRVGRTVLYDRLVKFDQSIDKKEAIDPSILADRSGQSDQIDVANLTTPIYKDNRRDSKESLPKPSKKRVAKAKKPEGTITKEVPPHVALIQAWWEELENKPVGKIPYARNAAKAKEMIEEGFRPDQVGECTKHYQAQAFWKTRHISLEFISKNIRAWSSTTKDRPGAALVADPDYPGTRITKQALEDRRKNNGE